jgi:putative ATP-dependent endonuclease of OLD family
MRLTSLKIRDYRSIETLDLLFPTFYSALCGKNDSGKTNIVRSIRAVFGADSGPFHPDDDLAFKRDFTSWKKPDNKDHRISITATCTIDPTGDAGLYLFLKEYLKLDSSSPLVLILESSCSPSQPEGTASIRVENHDLTPIQSQEVMNKLQSTHALMIHNSTETLPPYFKDRSLHLLGELSGSDQEALQAAKSKLNAAITRVVKQQQKGLSEILGRLKDRYKVGVSAPEIDPQHAPLAITLGEDAVDLDKWGSGTQNRTKTLLTLFKARRLSQLETSASKITPIVVIEEPESFLHPSAQAEFGRMLQDLAEEFQIQVLVSTHSPYMLSCQSPQSNLLIERKVSKSRLQGSSLVDTKSERWMEPFGLALGISNEEFEPWRKALFKNSDSVLLVEGQTDVEYFKLLNNKELKTNQLFEPLEVEPYGCKDKLKNAFFLRFIRQRHKHCIVTYDMDAEGEVLPILNQAGFHKGINCFSLGTEVVKSIEGLLPASIASSVLSARPELMNSITFGDSSQKKSAKSMYKMALLEEFKKISKPNDEYFKGFYPVVRAINRTLKNT